jgi:mRNA-degrading endonuclease RelE of RelBE toxin-antitoxin system
MAVRWLPGVLARIHELAAQQRVRFTLKALRELAELDMGLDEDDARDVLVKLVESEFAERVRSKSTGEWMYVFKPDMGDLRIYLKVALRADCVVISFHEERNESDEDA